MGVRRRRFMILLGIVSLGGCTGISNSNQQQNEPQEGEQEESEPLGESSKYDCGEDAESATEDAVTRYTRNRQDLSEVSDIIGSMEVAEVDSVFGGNQALPTLMCRGGSGGCATEFLSAIEDFERAKEIANGSIDGFEELIEYVEECNVGEPQLFTEQADRGIKKGERYVEAIDNLIESAKWQIDEDNEVFKRNDSFRSGVSQYQSAKTLGLMEPSELRQRATIYNG